MTIIGPGVSYEQLEETQANYLRPEALQRATARLVNFHLRQPLAQAWGQGLTSSSDAQGFALRRASKTCRSSDSGDYRKAGRINILKWRWPAISTLI